MTHLDVEGIILGPTGDISTDPQVVLRPVEIAAADAAGLDPFRIHEEPRVALGPATPEKPDKGPTIEHVPP